MTKREILNRVKKYKYNQDRLKEWGGGSKERIGTAFIKIKTIHEFLRELASEPSHVRYSQHARCILEFWNV